MWQIVSEYWSCCNNFYIIMGTGFRRNCWRISFCHWMNGSSSIMIKYIFISSFFPSSWDHHNICLHPAGFLRNLGIPGVPVIPIPCAIRQKFSRKRRGSSWFQHRVLHGDFCCWCRWNCILQPASFKLLAVALQEWHSQPGIVHCFCFFLGGPFSPFENSWHLKPEYRNSQKKQELADQ